MVAVYCGVYELYWTVIGEGKVICQLRSFDIKLTVMTSYLVGVCHYMFAAEYYNTGIALENTTNGLEIATSEFVNNRRSIQMLADEEVPIQERMAKHLKDSKRRLNNAFILHGSIVVGYLVLSVIGMYYFAASIAGFILITFIAVVVYFIGLRSI